jgi:hypothetical protein
VVAVDRSGTRMREDGLVALTTDRGFEVVVARAYLVQAQAQLVDCLGLGSDVWDDWLALRSWLGPSIAYAGHSESSEPSAVIAPRAIDLVRGRDEDPLRRDALRRATLLPISLPRRGPR